jgi:P4 family phage/plasmid primase-like protien
MATIESGLRAGENNPRIIPDRDPQPVRPEPPEEPPAEPEPEPTPEELLERAAALEGIEQARAMGDFLHAIVGLSELEQDAWLAEAKSRTGFGKTVLGRQLKDVAKEAIEPPPGQRELGDRWIEGNPNTAQSLVWRRYEAGHWPEVAKERVELEIDGTVTDAESEGVEYTDYLVKAVYSQVERRCFVSSERWDADPSLLVCRNGTLNLETRELREHDPKDYATGAVTYDYDPDADCPTLRYVLAGWGAEVADFLQEFAGYALTTDCSLETAIWLKGDPGGGKSTLLEGLHAMLGGKCGTLGIANIERSRFGLAAIEGKTLLIASDQPGGYVSASNVLNNIISGESIRVERKYEHAVDLIPRAKIAWSMNKLPRIEGGGNNGLFRRVKVVEIPSIPDNERDPRVKELVKAEGAGILNWALEGLQRLRARGDFDPSDDILQATRRFQIENDKPALFAEENLVFGDGYEVAGGRLYGSYKTWCEVNGYRPEASQTVADDWRRLGLSRVRRSDGAYWLGAKMASGV